MSDLPRPLTESYWVKPGNFLAGEHPARSNPEATLHIMDAFLSQGFDTFIDLTCEGERPFYQPILMEEARRYNIQAMYRRFPIVDLGLPTHAQMLAILNTIDAALADGHKIYLHCWGGIGRTGTVVGCYLMRHGLSNEQALGQLAEWWRHVPKSIIHPRSPETNEQVKFLQRWKE